MDKSKMGYRDDSPFRKEPFIDISTPNGLIDMSGTGIPLLANGRVLPPYSGTHQFEPGIVRETPLMQEGDETKPEKRLSWKDWKTDAEMTREQYREYITDPKFPTLPAASEYVQADMNGVLEWMRTEGHDNNLPGSNDLVRWLVANKEGFTEDDWYNVANTVAFHETGPKQRMSPTAIQKVTDKVAGSDTFDQQIDGPGMGMYQFEIEPTERFPKASGGWNTAINRTARFLLEKGYPIPVIDAWREGVPDNASEASEDLQTMIFFGDKIQHPNADTGALASGDITIDDFWAKSHKGKYDDDHLTDFAASTTLANEQLPLWREWLNDSENEGVPFEFKSLGGSVNAKRERTKKLVRQYRDGGSLTPAGKKHLEDIGVIDIFQGGGEYTVKRGDTLSQIAASNDMTENHLSSLNNISNRNRIYPGQKLQLSAPVVTGNANEEEEPVITGYDHHESFNSAFGAAREDLGVNHIFDYKGSSFNTNLANEPLNMPASVRTNLGNQLDQVDSLYSSRSELNITAAQDSWQNWDQKREDIADFNRMGNVDVITGYESGRLGGSSTETISHTIVAGDNLSVLAQKHGSTVDAIADANPQISNPSAISVGDNLKIPAVRGETYMILNKQTHELQAYRQGSDTPFATYLVGTGTIEGDAQTVTVSKDLNNDGIRGGEGDENARGGFDVDWRAGNSQTGAGIFTLDGIVEKSQGYYDETGQGRSIPSFGLKNENGFRIATGIHGVPHGLKNTSRKTNVISDDITKKNMTHGCINGRCSDLREMYDNPGITEGTKLYILPEEEGNEFVYQNGKLVFKSSAENRKKYSEGYTDEDGIEQPYSQGINRSPFTLKYNPIKIEFDRDQMQKDKNDGGVRFEQFDSNNEEEYNEITAPFLEALINNKQQIMKIAEVNGDMYNDIVKLTIGLFGQESGFGEKNSSPLNQLKMGIKATKAGADKWLGTDYGSSSSADPLFEQKAYEGVNAANLAVNTAAAMKGLPTKDFGIDIDFKSVGWTQLRWDFLDDDEKSKLAKLGITSGSDFNDPIKAAIGTAAILSVRSQTQTGYQDYMIADNDKFSHITNRQEALVAGWNPSGPEYVNNVMRYGNYATLYEIDAEGVSGELTTNYDKEASGATLEKAIRLYEEYVGGWFKEGGEVKALYNKLNRVYYTSAKAAKTSVLDYMKSQVD